MTHDEVEWLKAQIEAYFTDRAAGKWKKRTHRTDLEDFVAYIDKKYEPRPFLSR